MFDFHFAYSDGNTYDIKNVNKISLQTPAGTKDIVGKDILSTYIPLETMSLYTDNGNVTISGTNLMVIDILKQKD